VKAAALKNLGRTPKTVKKLARVSEYTPVQTTLRLRQGSKAGPQKKIHIRGGVVGSEMAPRMGVAGGESTGEEIAKGRIAPV